MKKIMTLLTAFLAVTVMCLMFSCNRLTYKSKENYAQGKVPMISEENGKFTYISQLKKATLTYPVPKVDSLENLSRLPSSKLSPFNLFRDSLKVNFTIPSTKLLVDMDSLKFIYPPDAKFSVPQKIWWKKTDKIALSRKFWLVGTKDGVTNVYTPEGEIVPEPQSSLILISGREEPLKNDSTP